MMSAKDFESQIDQQCSLILRTDSEFWEIRNKAILQLTTIISTYKDADPSVIPEVFNANVFRMLKDPVKIMVNFASMCLIVLIHIFSSFLDRFLT